MGVRLRNTHYSLNGTLYKVEIYDSDWAGAVSTFDDEGFKISWDDESDNFNEPLKPSSCRYILHDDGSGTFDAYKSDLASAQENEFQLVISKWNGSSYDLYWCGVIMPDMVMWNNENTPRQFEIIAKDGINRLADLPFTNIESSPFTTDPQTFMYIIEKCLAKNGLASFHSGDYIKVSVDWYDTQMSTSEKQRIFERVRIWGEMLRKDIPDNQSKKTDVDPLYCREVIASLLQIFHARMIYSEGCYHIEQVKNFTSSTQDEALYDSSGTYDSIDTSVSNRVTSDSSLYPLAGGKFGYHAAYNRVKLTARGYLDVRGAYIENMTVNRGDTSETTTLQLGTITGGTGRDIEIDFDLSNYTTSQILASNIYTIVDVKLICGSYRIKNKAGYTNTEVSEWTTTAADKWSYRMEGYDLSYKKLRVVALDIPFATETNCTAEITISIFKKDGASWTGGGLFPTTNTDFFSEIRNVRCIMWDSTIDSLGDVEVIVNNPDYTANSLEFDYGKILIGDNPLVQRSISSKNSFEIYKSGGTWDRPNVWEAGFTTDYNLVTTMLMETMALRKTPTLKYMGTFAGSYAAHKSISYDSAVWVVNRLELDSNTDEWSGTWFAIQVSRTNVTQSTERLKPSNATFGLPPYRINNIPLKDSPAMPINPKGKGAIPYEQGDSMTTITVEALDTVHLREGDKLLAYHPTSLELLHEFTIDADTSVSDTSITVVSDNADADIPSGAILEHNAKLVIETGDSRYQNSVLFGGEFANLTVIDETDFTSSGGVTFYQMTAQQRHLIVMTTAVGTDRVYLPLIADATKNGQSALITIKANESLLIYPHPTDTTAGAQLYTGGTGAANLNLAGGNQRTWIHDGSDWHTIGF